MKKSTLISLIVAAALIMLGVCLFACAMSLSSWDFDALSTENFISNVYEVAEPFHDISIQTLESSIEFKISPDGTCKVECMESEHVTYRVSVQDGTLQIATNDTREWYHHIGIFNTQRQNMTVYLPEAAYKSLQIGSDTGTVQVSSDFTFSDVQVKMDTGAINWEAKVLHSMSVEGDTGFVQISNVEVDGILSVKTATGRAQLCGVQAQSIEVRTSTGKAIVTDATVKDKLCVTTNTGNAELTGCRAAAIIVETDTGKARLTDAVATGSMQIETNTGDVSFDSCDAANITVTTDTGDVRGTLCSGKVFACKTDTGKIDLPDTTTGGVCSITTDTGDIVISIVDK